MQNIKKPVLIAIVRDDEGRPQPQYSTSAGLKFSPVKDRRDRRVRGMRPLESLVAHWSLARGAEQDLMRALDERAPDAAAAYRRAVDSNEIGAFSAALDDFGKAIGRWKKRTGDLRHVADATIYHYTAPIVSLAQSWRRRQTEPTLINLLGKIATGTLLESWQYYEEAFDAGLPKRTSSHNPAESMAQPSEEREPILFRFAWSTQSCSIDGRERERHEAMQGAEGAPNWDLYGQRVDTISKQVYRDIARLVAFGDPIVKVRGILETRAGFASGDLTGAGLLAVGPVAYLAGDVASYDALNDEIRAQAEMVDQDEELLADALALPPTDFRFLTQELLDAGGTSDGKVMQAFWDANPQIAKISWAHELAPRAKDEQVFLKHGKSAAEAARLSGGIRVADTQRACAMLYTDNPDNLAWIEGLPMQVMSYPEHRGQEDTLVRASTGGAQCFAKGHRAEADPGTTDPTGAYRIFWRE